MSDLAHEAIEVFGKKIPYFEGTSTYDLGKYTFTETDTGTLYGVIQPAQDAQVANLAEGQRAPVKYTLHTKKELKIGVSGAAGDGKIDTYIEHKGEKYKAAALADWSDQSFYKYALLITQLGR